MALLIRRIVIFIIVIIGGYLWTTEYRHKLVDTTAPVTMTQEAPAEPTLSAEQESALVTNYITNNIKTITTKEPVLGGTWYVVSVDVDTATKTAVVLYEDGHIQAGAAMMYTIDNGQVSVNITSESSD